jgi:GT2 family glycosyltransferase
MNSLKSNKKVKTFRYDKPFNYSALNNFGRKQASGDYLVLLNNDTEVIDGNWLGELLGVAAQPWAGAVAPLLLYPNNKIQHAGVILGMDTMAGHIFRRLREDALTPFGRPYWPRNFLAVTAACLAVKTTKYDEVKGLDEKLVTCGNDVAFCLQLHEKGYRNVYWPFARLYHYESMSVGSYKYVPTAQADYDRSLTYYKPYLNWHDPYFNRNLSLMVEQIGLRESYEEAH